MSFDTVPVVGRWYRRADRPQAFQVVAVDLDRDSIDLEYFDGTLDEWPLQHWMELDIEACEAPQDWSGPYDSGDGERLDESESSTALERLIEPIEAAQDAADQSLLEAQAAEFAAARPSPPAPRKPRRRQP